MEHMGAEGQWTSLSGIYTAEEADFMALLLSNSVPSSIGTNLPSLWPGHESLLPNVSGGNYGGSNCSLELSNSSFYSNTTSGDSSPSVFPTSSNEQYCLSTDVHPHKNSNSSNNCAASMSFDFNVEGYHKDYDEIGNGSSGDVAQEKSSPSDENINSAKRTRCSQNVCSQNVEIGKRNVRSRRKQKLAALFNNDEEGNVSGANNGQSSSSCYSGDESINGRQERSGGGTSSLSPKQFAALNSDGKTRDRRGSATDPQSLYARKRRERINERLRILQNLVPNGTKVDISTMLEEAVQYVKFLQLQIKLLSSDELWMYAPIAYNGKEIGLDHLKLAMVAKQS